MKIVIQDFSELSESKELLRTKPHSLGIYFIYIVIGMIIIVTLWATVTEVDIVVKANGVVRPTESVSTITSTYTGKIVEFNYFDGQEVKKGDIIFTVDAEELHIELSRYLKQISSLEEELMNQQLLNDSILNNKNMFESIESDIAEKYYYRYLKYCLDIAKINDSIDSYKYSIADLNEELSNLSKLRSSVISNMSKFEEREFHSDEYQLYQSYLFRCEELKIELAELDRVYNSNLQLYENGSVSENVLINSKLKLEQTKIKVDRYKSETLTSVSSSIDTKESKLILHKQELSKLVPQPSENITFNKSYFETETLIALNNEIQQSNLLLHELYDKKEKAEINISNSQIIATHNGYLLLEHDFAEGDFITIGYKVGMIVPKDGDSFKIQLYVPNKNISEISVGDVVYYKFHALDYKEFGMCEGEIVRISVDAKQYKENSGSYYLVEADVRNKPLSSYKGNDVSIKVGMTLDAQIKVKTKNTMQFILEKIDLW